MAEVDVGALDELLRALASPQRRRMLQLTWSQERTASELSEMLELAPASASEHLKVLRKLGLVEMRAEGTFRVYRACPSKVGQLIGLLNENFPDPADGSEEGTVAGGAATVVGTDAVVGLAVPELLSPHADASRRPVSKTQASRRTVIRPGPTRDPLPANLPA